ncbi:MAG TPA: type III PLP-dependent enzyme [Spirillospora sp.]|nr:type III PLP-dependent enzyme [Spirillospora sp.]
MLDADGHHRLAEEYGTPLYVYDGAELTGALDALRAALPAGMEVFYSLKANPNLGVCGLLIAHGARAEVSSLVELITAVRAGATPAGIVFLGPGKSEAELRACVATGVWAVVAESFAELDDLDRIAAEAGTRQRVLVRVNPAAGAARSGLSMGGKPRQFGIDEQALLDAGPLAGRHPHLDLAGVHAYLGTRILDARAVAANTALVLATAERVAAATGIRLDAVDVGGGLGVAYFDGESDLDLGELRTAMAAAVGPFKARHPGTRLMLETGRFLTARAGTYLMRVRYVKESMGKRFAVTDGGTHHHMAAVGIGSYVKRNFPVRLPGRAGEPAAGPWQITGPLCTPHDLIAKDVPLPDPRPGDLVAVERSGAYGPTASPGLFLSHGFPAEVLVHEGTAHLVRHRDAPADLLARQRLPLPFQKEAPWSPQRSSTGS